MQRVLRNGTAFPEFSVPALGGGTLDIPGDLAGSYGVVLIFRGAWCPLCNEQIAAYAEMFDRFKQEDIKLLAFSADGEPETAALAAKHKVEFPLGHSADVDKIVDTLGAFDTTREDRGRFLEGTGFILTPESKILCSVYSSLAIGRLTPQDVLRLVTIYKKRSG